MSLTFPRSNSGGVVVNVYEAIISAFKIRVSSEIHKSSSENSGGDIAGALGLLLDINNLSSSVELKGSLEKRV